MPSVPEVRPRIRARVIAYFSIVVVILFVYIILSEVVYPNLIGGLVKKFIHNATQANVGRVPEVSMTLRGGLVLHHPQLITSRNGDYRPFYTAEKMIVLFDVMPLFNQDVRLKRIELIRPEIYVICAADGVWNVEWVFEPKRESPPPPTDHPADATQEVVDHFPYEGVHIVNGTIHVMVVNEKREQTDWRIQNVSFPLTRSGANLQVGRIQGDFYMGKMMGDVIVNKVAPLEVDIRLRFDNARLEQIVAPIPAFKDKEKIHGALWGNMSIKSNAEETQGRAYASGNLVIKEGNIWELPVFYSILNVLSLHLPGKASFDEAKLSLTVEQSRIKIREMNFLGYPVSLFGDGEMGLNGKNLDMTFVPRMGKKSLDEIIPVIGAPTQELLNIVKGTLIPISVTGSIDDPQASWSPFKPITAPVRALINLFSGGD